MDSYDNDEMLLALDDDLFWREKEKPCGDVLTTIRQEETSETALSVPFPLPLVWIGKNLSTS